MNRSQMYGIFGLTTVTEVPSTMPEPELLCEHLR